MGFNEVKQQELKAIEVAKKKEGIRGFLDKGIYESICKLNSVPEIVTLQSCNGHDDSDAHLWLAYNGNQETKFSEVALKIMNNPKILELSLSYRNYQGVTVIWKIVGEKYFFNSIADTIYEVFKCPDQ